MLLGSEMRRAWGAVVGWPWLADQPHTATPFPLPPAGREKRIGRAKVRKLRC